MPGMTIAEAIYISNPTAEHHGLSGDGLRIASGAPFAQAQVDEPRGPDFAPSASANVWGAP